MKMLIALAWRNLWRNSRRTVLTLLTISLAGAVLSFFMGLQDSAWETSIQTSIRLFHGHLQVQRSGYFDKPEIRRSLEQPEKILSSVRAVDGVEVVTPRAFGFALVSSDARSLGVQVIGVDPALEPEVSSIPGTIKRGRYLKEAQANEVVLGETLANNLRVNVGDELTMLGQGRDGSVAATVLTVAGIFESGTQQFDRQVLEMPLEAFQETFTMEGGVHTLVIRLRGLNEVLPAQARIQEALSRLLPGDSDVVVYRWDQLLPGLRQAVDLDVAAAWLFFIALVAIVGMSVLNTFTMSVLERTREFGILLALGQRPWQLSAMIVLEGMILSVLGVLFGLLIGICVMRYYGIYGFQVPGAQEFFSRWNLPTKVFVHVSPRAIIAPTLVLSISGLLAAAFPALRVSRIKPVEALRSI